MQNMFLLKKGGNDLWTSSTLIKLIMFVIWPVGAVCYSLRTPNKYSSYLIYFLSVLLFSWSMYYDDRSNYIDFIGVSERFYEIGSMALSDVMKAISEVFSEDSEYTDVYNIMVVWLTGQFTSNFHFQYVVAAIPFMLFMLASMRYLSENPLFKVGVFGLILIFLFLIPRDPFHIQNFRFATATWMAVYGILRYFLSGKRLGLLWLFLTPFVHSSFWFLVVIALMYIVLLRNAKGLIKLLFFISIPISFISTDLFMGLEFSFLPDVFQEWSAHYLSKEAYKDFGMENVWSGTGLFFVRVTFHILRNVFYLLIPLLVLSKSEVNKSPNSNNIFFWFYLFYFAVVNIIQSVPVLGFRFYGLVRILSILVWLIYLSPKYKFFIYALLFSCAYEVVFEVIPLYMKVLDWDFFISNVFSLIVKHWGISSFPHF